MVVQIAGLLQLPACGSRGTSGCPLIVIVQVLEQPFPTSRKKREKWGTQRSCLPRLLLTCGQE